MELGQPGIRRLRHIQLVERVMPLVTRALKFAEVIGLMAKNIDWDSSRTLSIYKRPREQIFTDVLSGGSMMGDPLSLAGHSFKICIYSVDALQAQLYVHDCVKFSIGEQFIRKLCIWDVDVMWFSTDNRPRAFQQSPASRCSAQATVREFPLTVATIEPAECTRSVPGIFFCRHVQEFVVIEKLGRFGGLSRLKSAPLRFVRFLR